MGRNREDVKGYRRDVGGIEEGYREDIDGYKRDIGGYG